MTTDELMGSLSDEQKAAVNNLLLGQRDSIQKNLADHEKDLVKVHRAELDQKQLEASSAIETVVRLETKHDERLRLRDEAHERRVRSETASLRVTVEELQKIVQNQQEVINAYGGTKQGKKLALDQRRKQLDQEIASKQVERAELAKTTEI